MTEKYTDLALPLRFQVICDSCAHEEYYRTEIGASVAADLHEIATPTHTCTVRVYDKNNVSAQKWKNWV